MKPYYYVYRYGDNAPKVRHTTLRSAIDEAIRLAEGHPSVHFEILRFVGFASTTKANVFWADEVTPRDIEQQ